MKQRSIIILYLRLENCIMKKIFVLAFISALVFACNRPSTKAVATAANPEAPAAPAPKPVATMNDSTIAMKKQAAKETAIRNATKNVGETASPKESPTYKLNNGKQVYYAKCSTCHAAKNPEDYTADRWVKIVDWMGPRAKITAEEKENILVFVKELAKKS
jgi:cytochrome c5